MYSQLFQYKLQKYLIKIYIKYYRKSPQFIPFFSEQNPKNFQHYEYSELYPIFPLALRLNLIFDIGKWNGEQKMRRDSA